MTIQTGDKRIINHSPLAFSIRYSVATVEVGPGNITIPEESLRFLDKEYSAGILETFPVGNIIINIG